MPKIPSHLLTPPPPAKPLSIADAARAVKIPPQMRDSKCRWPGCSKVVPPAMWGCYTHWAMLPKEIADRLWKTYNPQQKSSWLPSPEYIEALEEAQAWIAKTCGSCKACGGTALDSKGQPCHPCSVNARKG